jgi:hypothetical protein
MTNTDARPWAKIAVVAADAEVDAHGKPGSTVQFLQVSPRGQWNCCTNLPVAVQEPPVQDVKKILELRAPCEGRQVSCYRQVSLS